MVKITPIFITCYKHTNGGYETYNIDTEEYDTLTTFPRECNMFELLNIKIEEPTKKQIRKAIKEYAYTLQESNKRIKESKILPFKFDIFTNSSSDYYQTSHLITTSTYFRLTHKDAYETLEQPTLEEFEISELCKKSGLIYGNNDTTLDFGYSYDHRMFYPRLMACKKFYFPRTHGKMYKFSKLTFGINTIKFGYYKCNIVITNPLVKKGIALNDNNWYTHFDLIAAMKLEKYYGGIEIIPLGRAYLYEDDQLVNGEDVFGAWYGYMIKLKEKFPKCALIKSMTSMLWGKLTHANTFKCNEKKAMELLEDDNYKIVSHHEPHNNIKGKSSSSYFILRDKTKQIQKYAFNIKCWITGYARLEMVRVLLPDLDKIERIMVDGFIMNTRFKDIKKYKTLLYEKDKSGKMYIKNSKFVTLL